MVCKRVKEAKSERQEGEGADTGKEESEGVNSGSKLV